MADAAPTSGFDAQAWSQQYDQQEAAQKSQELLPKQEAPHPFQAVSNWVSSLPSRINSAVLDQAVPAVESVYNSKLGRADRDIVAGATTGVKNVADAAVGVVNKASRLLQPMAEAQGAPAAQTDVISEPIWSHAKSTVQDFTDAVKVKDPGIADNLLQYAAQVAPSYLLAGRLLNELHGVANVVASGAAADASALDPHAPRFADILGVLKQTDGKIGQALRAAGPYGLNAYINYLGSNANETEAQGRFKNALDGILPNFIGTELLHAAGITVKQGYAGLRYMVDNGVASAGDLGAKSAASQRGGPAAARQAMTDPSEGIATEQARKDMEAAAANPHGKRPPLNQPGVDPAQSIIDEQARQDMINAEPPGQLAYHGTPHDFDTEAGFDNSKIGTGEGAQTYGYGHYLAETPETASTYQAKLAARTQRNPARDLASQALEASGGDSVAAYKALGAQRSSLPRDDANFEKHGQIAVAQSMLKAGTAGRGAGSLVTAEIPARHLESMIDNDKPMSAQPKVLEKIGPEDQEKLEKLLDDHGENPDLTLLSGNEFRQLIERAHGEGVLTGGDPAESHEPKLAAQYLDSKGIAGIKYADALSRNPVLTDAAGKKLDAPSRVISLLQEAEALHSVKSGGDALNAAIARAKARGWDNPKAFYQDREALEKLEELKEKGAKFGMAGTRNFVVFDGKKIKVTGKEK